MKDTRKITRNTQWFALALLVVLLAACSTATPDVTGDLESLAYVPLGGALDSSLAEDAINTSIVVDDADRPYVAWQESSFFAYNNNVRYWNGSSWVSLDSTDREIENSAGQPSLAKGKAFGNNLYVAWNEYDYFDAFGNDPLTRHNVTSTARG